MPHSVFSFPGALQPSASLSASLKRKINYVHIFIFLWVALVWFGERTYPYSVIQRCSWKQLDTWQDGVSPTRVALIADPQLIDKHTYPGRPAVLEALTEFVTDRYLRRNWVYINSALDPDANVFLGDLFDGGREWNDKVFLEEFERFNKIFTKPVSRQTIMSLPGNHDIGFGDTVIPHAYERFKVYFGEPSSKHQIGNHTFVLLDTLSMMNSKNSTFYQPPNDFMKEITSEESFEEFPRILLTHVPLYRDPALGCGPMRESKKPWPYVRGDQFQTMLSPEVTDSVLRGIRPAAVFSGDDHDACYAMHNYTLTDEADDKDILHAEENTVKSISMAMGILKPAIQLLSLHNPTPGSHSKTLETSICFMPSPFHAFFLYFLFGGFTVSIILLVNFLPVVFPASALTYLSKTQHDYTAVGREGGSGSGSESFNLHEMHPRSTSFDHEDQDSHDPETLEEFKRNQQSALYRAGNAITTRKSWKTIFPDFVFIFGTAFAFYMFLSYSIYW